MAKHHITPQGAGLADGLVINGIGALLSAVVDVIIAVTKFTDGAWVIIVLVPLLVVVFLCGCTASTRARTTQLERRRPTRPRPPRSCAATSCWCSSTSSTWPPPGPSSTPARSRPTTCGPCTSRRPRRAARAGRGLAATRPGADHRSTSSTAPTGACSPAALEPGGPRAGRRRHRGVASCSPTASTAGLWHRILHDQTADEHRARRCRAGPRQRHDGALPLRPGGDQRGIRRKLVARPARRDGAARRGRRHEPAVRAGIDERGITPLGGAAGASG